MFHNTAPFLGWPISWEAYGVAVKTGFYPDQKERSTSGQSYKAFTRINYDSRVVIANIYDCRYVNYDRRVIKKLTTVAKA